MYFASSFFWAGDAHWYYRSLLHPSRMYAKHSRPLLSSSSSSSPPIFPIPRPFNQNILMWQLRAFNVLLMSLQSTVNLCILPFILLSPLRWRQIKSSFVEYCGISNKDTTFHKYTTDLFDNFEDFSDLIFPAVGDIISYPFILFTTLYPEVDYVFPFISFPMVCGGELALCVYFL